MRFMNRLWCAALAASSLVFALPVRADDGAQVTKSDQIEPVLASRDQLDDSAPRRTSASRGTEKEKASAATPEESASHEKAEASFDGAFSDPITSSGP